MRGRRITRAVAALVAVVAPLVVAQPAGAGDAPRPGDPVAVATAEQALVSQLPLITSALGDDYAGAWFDDGGTLHVKVAGASDPTATRSLPSGAVLERAARTSADLAALRDRVVADAADPELTGLGIATVAVDDQSSQVVVGITGDASAAAAALTRRYGSAVAVEATTPPAPATRADPSQPMKAGLEISSSESFLCSSSFGAHRGGQRFVMTAGHCGSNGSAWRIGSNTATPYFGTAGRRLFVSGSTSDSLAITVANSKAGPADCVYESDALCRPVIGSATYLVQGQQVCKSGRTTGVTCGAIRATDVSVIYGGENVTIQHAVSACVNLDSGDSGAPVYVRPGGSAVAVGILSGSSTTTSSCGGNILLPATIMYFTRWTAATFTPGIAPMRPGYREPTDFNGDTCGDLVGQYQGYLFTYAGSCAGGLTGASQFAGDGWNIFDTALRTPDFSGDGCSDVIARAGGNLYLYRGSCGGGFAGYGQLIGDGWHIFSTVIAPGDFTGDGCADVMGLAPNGDLYLYPGGCLGSFAGGGVLIGRGWNIFSTVVAPGDFSGDGCADLLGIVPNGDMYLYRGNCAGSFTAGSQMINAGWNIFSRILGPGDFNGDGCSDLIGMLPNGSLFMYGGGCNGGFVTYAQFFSSGWNAFERIL